MIGGKVRMKNGRIFKRSGIYSSLIHTYFFLVKIHYGVLINVSFTSLCVRVCSSPHLTMAFNCEIKPSKYCVCTKFIPASRSK